MQFHLDEIVQFKVGGPRMTVVGINVDNDAVTCAYRTQSGDTVRTTVMPCTLKSIDPCFRIEPVKTSTSALGI